ncbi:patatin-like phospholipase family protein [Sphingobium sp. DEHP117]|uniref:patatin-like phospholipase family protein n=1 Tax=Sphingobium sp. DEHP117 TaxID=2993436 RepID=UPI0027D56724|nr:patatin-like phospholipase family protein [Sphingobium sp. DEHP117]MDQ4419265.1 patatin-like phospholipase family protein [Sphingobium sp. DEHP117]
MSNLQDELSRLGQIVLVFQGGGALGAYQVGVYQALHEAGIEPDWVVGTSIGAINASIIAGAPYAERMERLRDFWKRVETDKFMGVPLPNWFTSAARNMMAITTGIPAFFQPRPSAFFSPHAPLGSDGAGYYSVAPLSETLKTLVDFDQINNGPMRLTVGAANVRTAEMTYFDSRDTAIDVRHILASGALPPAFPAVRIGEDLFWDGGILSNTPVETVFDDPKRRSSVVFSVHLWNPHGPEPETIWQVMNRQKDLQYSSRAAAHIERQRQLHKLRHIIAELAEEFAAAHPADNRLTELASYGCTTRMHVIRLLAPALDYEDHAKDIDFSPDGIAQRWQAGYRHTMDTLNQAPWRGDFDPLEGFILHEACGGELVDQPLAAE